MAKSKENPKSSGKNSETGKFVRKQSSSKEKGSVGKVKNKGGGTDHTGPRDKK
jgi:hypothetical protein